VQGRIAVTPALMCSRRQVVAGAAAMAITSTAAARSPRLVAPTPTTTTTPTPTMTTTTAAADEVEAVLERQRAAWNAGDLEGFCAVYADDCVFLSPSGLTTGRAQVLARYQKRYGQAKDTMGHLGFEVLHRQVGVDVVSLAMRWSLDVASERKSGLTLVCFAKGPTGWRLMQDASM